MKVLFVIAVDSVVDVITNSSSELFVLERMTKMEAEAAVAAVHAKYRSEYEQIVGIDELSVDELNTYISHAYLRWHFKITRQEAERVLDGLDMPLAFDEAFEMEDDGLYSSREVVTEENREEMIERIDPERELWFMFSTDENPNWQMQEALSNVATRYHLG